MILFDIPRDRTIQLPSPGIEKTIQTHIVQSQKFIKLLFQDANDCTNFHHWYLLSHHLSQLHVLIIFLDQSLKCRFRDRRHLQLAATRTRVLLSLYFPFLTTSKSGCVDSIKVQTNKGNSKLFYLDDLCTPVFMFM